MKTIPSVVIPIMAPVRACCPRYLPSMSLGSQSLMTAPDVRSLASFMKKRSPNSNESPAHFLPCSRSQSVLLSGPFLNLAIVSPAKDGIHVKTGSSCASCRPSLLSSANLVALTCCLQRPHCRFDVTVCLVVSHW